MDRMYDVAIYVFGHDVKDEREVVEALSTAFNVDHIDYERFIPEHLSDSEWDPVKDRFDKDGHITSVYVHGTASIEDGKPDYWLVEQISEAVWEQAGRYCVLRVNMFCTDDLPYELHMPEKEDYDKWLSKSKK